MLSKAVNARVRWSVNAIGRHLIIVDVFLVNMVTLFFAIARSVRCAMFSSLAFAEQLE
jgi:hypothetical protein